jgi:RimJ/RimL family protein N-acetyltransferase
VLKFRRPRPSDARALVAHLRGLLVEPGIGIPLALDEALSVEEQHDLLAAHEMLPNHFWLLAELDDYLAGQITLRPISPRRALAHVATLGISVASAARRRGVGRGLIDEALAWAPTAGYARIELEVYARNTGAIALYEQCGFVHEGLRRKMIREGDAYLDDCLMAKLL